jgi:hypothetical protein
VEPVIQKIPNTPEYKDYYKQRTDLEAKKDEIETKFQAARRSRDRDQIRMLQREQRENASQVAKLEMTHPGAVVRAMAVQDAARPRNSPVFIRGEAENKGDIVPRQFSGGHLLVRPANLSPTAAAARTRARHRQQEQSAHAARDGQSHLATSLRRGLCTDAG